MRLITITLAAAVSCAAVAPVFAGTARLSDTQYIAASRCVGLQSSKALESADASALKQLVKQQSWGRSSMVYDMADEAQETGRRDASRGGAEANVGLVSERDGVCHSLVASQTASAAAPAHTMQ
jgi:hypothetical protein